MGSLQIVFADNPRPAKGWKPASKPEVKNSLQSQQKSRSIKRKVGLRMKPSPKQLAWRKKFAKMAKARSKAARAKKKKKNPYQFVAKKGRRTIKTGGFASKRELKGLTKKSYAFDQAVGRGYLRKGSKRKRIVKRASAAIKRVLKAAPRARKKAVARAAKLRKQGYKIKKVYISPKSVLASAAKSVRRKKRKGGKRKHSRKGSIVAKKRRKKKSGAKRRKARRKSHKKSGRRRYGKRKARTIVLKRKGSGVYIRRNPNLKNMLESYSGFKVEELGSLLVGGAIYGTVDGMAAKYAPSIYAYAAKIPVVGTTVVPAAIGMALNYAGKKFGVKALSMVGEGIVGAAVVAMGIQASHYLPGVSSGVSGVDFTPGRGVLMGGYPRDGADFGNVDFTPGAGVLMGSQPQFGLEPQMGGYARDGADFGRMGELVEGFGEVPEGLGSLG